MFGLLLCSSFPLFFLKIFMHLLILGVPGLRGCARAFSSCGLWGSSPLRFAGFSSQWLLLSQRRFWVRGLQQLYLTGSRAQAQQMWGTGLAAPLPVGASQTRGQSRGPCAGGRAFNRRASRDVRSCSQAVASVLFLDFYHSVAVVKRQC